MNRLIFNLTPLLLTCFAIPSCKSPQIKKTSNNEQRWTKGEGRAQIYQKDVSLAKDRALRYAKRDAIRRKLGQLIKSKTITESGVWVKGEVVARSEGLVKDYRITSDRQSKDYYAVEILADVNPSDLTDQVQDLLDDWEKPVMFGVVSESFAKKKNDPYSNDTLQALEEFFLDKGFILNKTSRMQSLIRPPVSTSKVARIFQKAKSESDFDLIIFGTSTCRNAGKINYGGVTSGLISAQVNVSVSIFDIYTQRLIATASERAAYPHIQFETGCSQGISQKAVPRLGKKLFQKMLKKWSREYGSGKSIFVDLTGKLAYKSLYDFQLILRNEIRGVVDVIERNVSPKKNSLEVIYQGKVKDFIEEILNKKTNLSLKLRSKSARKLLFSL